ncbi:glycosyltransferase [Maridesulfovibrio zosterae]|uniref:glycosyltransferase n=1 Tax=Maridesulfovibrio zosterae TaxID=82171 RepID=UPI00042A7562|nr:glycosyltransferase [Maridesulfovibrio zosterae]
MKYDIGLVGSLCSCDIVTAVKLQNAGLKTVVLSKGRVSRSANIQSIPASIQKNLDKIDIINFNPGVDFYKKAKCCRLILSFSGSILGGLRECYPLKFLPDFPPIVNIATGSDVTEFINEQSFAARIYRNLLKTSPMNWMVEYPLALKFIQKYDIPNTYFMPFPGIAHDYFTPLPTTKKVRILNPSRIDWKLNDPGEWRASSNGNDRFIRAFARALDAGLDAEATLIFRGPDKVEAKKLVSSLGIDDAIIWKDELSRDQLLNEIREHHVVADQFDLGGFGGITIESMSIGRPVLIYLNQVSSSIMFRGDGPPVLNCHSEDEIFSQLMLLKDRSTINDISIQSQSWIMKYYSGTESLAEFIYHYYRLTGHCVQDYGWNHYSTK